MPSPNASHLAPHLRPPRRLLRLSASALAALSLAPAVAHAQLPPPATSSAKAPAAKAPAASRPAVPARHEQKAPASGLPAPALPTPAAKAAAETPSVPNAAAPVEEAGPVPSAPSAGEEDSGGVIIVPQDATEFPILRPEPKPKAKPRPLVARVGGVDVGAGTEAAALAKLQKEHQNRLAQPIVLRMGAREFWATRAELGASLPLPVLLRAARLRARPGQPSDVALRYEIDQSVAQKYLQKLAPALRREPQAIGDGLTGRAGEELSIGGSLARVKAAVESGGTSVELLPNAIPFVPRPQPVAPSSGDARFPIVLAEYSTRYNARLEDRTENLRISAREVDGTILQPGEVFSTNAAIGPRSTSRGFRAAHIFMGKKVIEGVGGGICQCATTVYNAAREADLTIVERHSHSLPVSYATPANDATIYWGQKDMKFRNNTPAPIMVRAFLKGGRFHAQILSAPATPAARP